MTAQDSTHHVRSSGFSGAFDGIIDFDRATRNPANPGQLLPAYDSGDHLHPNDEGYRAMAEAVDLMLLTKSD